MHRAIIRKIILKMLVCKITYLFYNIFDRFEILYNIYDEPKSLIAKYVCRALAPLKLR